MSKGLAVLLICAMLLPGASVPVPMWVESRFNPDTVKLRDVSGIAERIADGKLNLMLIGFLELVLRNSTDINLTRLDVYTAANQIQFARAVFDPVVALGFNTVRSVSPQVSQIGGASTLSALNQNSFINYQELLATGQTGSVGFSSSRSSTNSSLNLLNPSINGTLNFTFSQPLLQNRDGIQLKAPQQIARTQLTITSRQSEARIADIVAMAAGQYWDAVRARDNIKVLQQTLALAQKSYDRDKQALDLGALAGLDIYQSETQVAERKRDLVQAQYAYRSALDGLRRLIGADLSADLRAVELVLGDDPAYLPSRVTVLPYEEALGAALRVRPEMDSARRRVAIDELNARVAKNLMLPRLDISVQGSGFGLSGNQVPVTGPLGITTLSASGGLGNTLGQIFGFNSPTYGAGVQLTLPFRSTSARAQLSDALVARTRDQYTERLVQQQIIQDVRLTLNSIELANATIEAATLARDLARKNVEAEQQKYELGTITAFEVLDSQTRLSTSESALLNAYVGYQQAFVSYQRATWTLLDGLGMVLEMPRVR
ncbi:MAG: outer membrane protein [Bryobacterales bacterium]|nr:outer membrane protein [Bryobacterales bacterium]